MTTPDLQLPIGRRQLAHARPGRVAGRSRLPAWLSLQDTPLTIGFLGLLLYLFIIISFKLNIAAVAIGIGLLGVLTEGPIRVPAPLLLFTVFVTWCALGAFQSVDPTESWDVILTDGKLLLIMLVVANVLRTRGQFQWFMLTHVGTFFPFAVLLSMWWFVNGGGHAGRATGYAVYGNSNDLGVLALLATAAMLAIAQVADRQRLVRLAMIGMAGTTAVLITMTQSRAALIGLGLGLLPLLARLAMRNWKLLMAVPVALVLIVSFAPAGAWDRLSGLRNFDVSGDNQLDAEGSAGERWRIIQTASRITADNPLFGVGRGAYRMAHARYAPDMGGKDTHNTYLNLAAETGLPGLLLYLTVIGSVIGKTAGAIRQLKRVPATINRALMLQWLLGGLIGFLAAATFGSYSKLNFPAVYLMFLWAISDLELRKARIGTKEPAPRSPGGARSALPRG
jgi:O-antigen ligase